VVRRRRRRRRPRRWESGDWNAQATRWGGYPPRSPRPVVKPALLERSQRPSIIDGPQPHHWVGPRTTGNFPFSGNETGD
jgi:hypothetical protein